MGLCHRLIGLCVTCCFLHTVSNGDQGTALCYRLLHCIAEEVANTQQPSTFAILQTPQGWTLSFDCTTFPEDSWGLLLPQLRGLLQRWPSLSAATAAATQPPQTVVCSRKGQDDPIQELSSHLFPPTAAAVAAATVSNAEPAEGSSQEGAAASQGQDSSQAVPPAGGIAGPAAAEAAVPANVGKLVLELGWEVFKPRASEEEEEEPPVVDFALTVYNLQVRSQKGFKEVAQQQTNAVAPQFLLGIRLAAGVYFITCRNAAGAFGSL